MKAKNIYLVSVIISGVFIIIFALILVLINPKSKNEDIDKSQDNNEVEEIPIKPEKRPQGRPESKPGSKPQGRPGSKPQVRPEVRPEVRPPKETKSASFTQNCVEYHNKYRSKHQKTDSVSLSQTLTASAKSKADLMARTGDFSHTPNLKTGENLYYFGISRGSDQLFPKMDCSRTTKAWYDEIKDYDYTSPESSSGVVGHFTQMVWRSTKQIGCAKAYDKRSKIYVCCHYSPPGNVIGSYHQNVLPEK